MCQADCLFPAILLNNLCRATSSKSYHLLVLRKGAPDPQRSIGSALCRLQRHKDCIVRSLLIYAHKSSRSICGIAVAAAKPPATTDSKLCTNTADKTVQSANCG